MSSPVFFGRSAGAFTTQTPSRWSRQNGCSGWSDFRGGPNEPPRVFGGVRLDVKAAANYLGDATGGQGGLPGRACQVCVLAPYFPLIDLPLSRVGDTLTLPWADGWSANKPPLPER